ncbi:uncharacterized protein LOC136041357 [Artemia franciscana]|uniref:uncharacterized protein LOC136041357 n=1 Tax=Artemia franciscana TaxID=6661 RepID=UPI0032DA7FC2
MDSISREIAFPDSRVVDEENFELDDDSDAIQSELLVKQYEGTISDGYSKIFVFDSLMSKALKKSFLRYKKVATFTCKPIKPKEYLENSDFKQKIFEPSEMYQIDASTCVLFTGEDLLEEAFYDFTNSVFNFASANPTFITSAALPAATHQCGVASEESVAPFVRSLNTSSYKKKVSLKPLEQPNILPGITASILSKCHCMKISALSLVLYIDTMSVDSIGWERLRHHVGNIPGGHVFYNVYVDRKLSCEGGQMFM